jgi:hypothetical protein
MISITLASNRSELTIHKIISKNNFLKMIRRNEIEMNYRYLVMQIIGSSKYKLCSIFY